MFLKANSYIEDVYNKRAIDLIQPGPKYDVLIELMTNHMKISKNPIKKLFYKSHASKNSSGKKQKKPLKSLSVKDLCLIPDEKLSSERIGITFDNYLGYAIRNNNFEATKYLLSRQIFPIDFQNSSGFTYFHI